ncbi:cytochrome D1 domain-containing protein [Methylotetracoccus oryzae]|uniref:cytochrome D1 domain-containing protein n=1 Tax=Methylotetracoccus oryzae TaxID=1919059 RepID=UPI001118658A|nr:cytochrome D1 domain-containing protein [Methylotetracoccus oryzae]
MKFLVRLLALVAPLSLAVGAELRGTGDLGVVVERAEGSVQIVDTTRRTRVGRITGLGDLSHATAVFSRDERYAYLFGRDGALTKLDLLAGNVAKRAEQAHNSVGGAISQDGRLLASSNYTPGGVRVFSAETLERVADIPAEYGNGQLSKVVGLVDAPGQRFVFSLFEAGEIWVADLHDPKAPKVQKFKAGKEPYDALISPDGRYYIAGLFGEEGLALLDLWNLDAGVKRILPVYAKTDEKLPVFKMPHLEGRALVGDYWFLPAVGHHEMLVVDRRSWEVVKRIPLEGQPVFVIARPDDRQIWVNFALPDNDKLHVIDTQTLSVVKRLAPGKAVLHMEFTPKGEEIWVSARDDDRLVVYDTETLEEKARLPADKPSGIFFTARAHRLGL